MAIRPAHLLTALAAAATAATIFWPGRDTLTGRTTLRMTVWGMPFEDRLFVDRYAKPYEAAHPAIAVDYRRYADVKTKYNAWHAQGRGAELMRIEMTWYHEFVRRGLIVPLGPFIRDAARGLSAEQWGKIPPHLRRVLEVDGEVYALPMDSAVYGLYYNRAIFEEYNAEHPEAPVRYPDATWSWDDLRRTAGALTKRNASGDLVRRGFDFAVWSWPFLTLHAQAGGEIWSADGQTCLVDSPAGVKALEFLRTMQREGSFSPTLGSYRSGTGADVLFGTGLTAMIFDGSWRAPNLELNYPGLDFAVAPLPRGEKQAVVTGSVLWAISSSARHKDEAWDLLRWLLADEQAAAYWDTLRVAPPANLAVLASDAMRSTAGVLKVPGDPSAGYDVPPMPESLYPARAAWIAEAFRVDPATGAAPGFLPAHEFQYDLNAEIDAMLRDYLAPGSKKDAAESLRGVVRSVHGLIDRTRAARGEPPVQR